jgi:hypothetical protein
VEILSKLFSSKKFVGLLVGLVVTIATRYGLDPQLASEIATPCAGMVGAYLLAQGAADHGKEAAKEAK